MINLKKTAIRGTTVGEVQMRAQKMNAAKEVQERNNKIPVFMFKGFGFLPQYTERGRLYMEGPLCPLRITKNEECYNELKAESEAKEVHCEICEKSLKLPHPYQQFRELAHKRYEGRLRFEQSGGKVETLDVPYEAIKAEDEDETRRIRIKWSQKDGRNQAIVYFISLVDNKEGDKVQTFVDIDREEFRHDAIDEEPGKILAKVKAEFKNTTATIEYKD